MTLASSTALPFPFSLRRLAVGGLALGACLFAGTAGAANCTANVVDGQLYSVANGETGKVLDVTAGSTQPGAALQQWGYGGSANQQFYVRSTGDGHWTSEGKASRLLLDVSGAALGEGAKLVQWQPNGRANQQWLLKKSTTGGYNIVARHSGKSLTVGDGASGAPVYQATDTAAESQRWFFNPVSGACGGGADGFAGQSGTDGLATTTGGGNAAPIVVTSCNALASALGATSAAVIHIPAGTTIDCRTPARSQSACAVSCPSYQDPGKSTYRIPVGTQTCKELGASSETRYQRTRNERGIRVASNKTLLGLGSTARILGASLDLSNAKNVIVRNLALEDINPGLVEGGDGITLNNSSHVWIDHVRFSMISDGHVDIQNSRNVTLSWNRFDGANPNVCGGQHHYTSAVTNSQVSFHHNFWNRASGRNPKLDGTATRAHLYNNYWRDISYFAINASGGAQAKVEANHFANSARPHWDTGGGLIEALNGSNRYTGISATDPYRNSGARVFGDVSLYRYTLDAVDGVAAQVEAGAGPR